MMSLAKNDRGIRMASAALLLLPLAGLIYTNSNSEMVHLVTGLTWFIFAALSLIAFLYDMAEEDSDTPTPADNK